MLKQIVTVLMFVKEINSSKEWYQKFLSIEPLEDLANFTSFKIGSICNRSGGRNPSPSPRAHPITHKSNFRVLV